MAAVRVAFVGKGGSGKSVLAGTVARLWARAGHRVLAVDSDPMPGLSLSLGVPSTDAGIPDEAVEERPDGEDGARYRLRAGLGATAAVERYALHGPDGVRVLQYGKLRGHVGPYARSQHAFSQICKELPEGAWTMVGDLPGGTRQAFFGWASWARVLVVVAEPTAKGILSARRLAGLRDMAGAPRVVAVANKAREPDDAGRLAQATGLEVVGAVPYDEAVVAAERGGRALVEAAEGSDALAAVRSVAARLEEAAT